MLLEKCSDWEILYHIFDQVDNLIEAMKTRDMKRLLPSFKSKGGRPSGLTLQAILTFAVFRFAVGIKDIKHYHRYLLSHFSKELGRIPNYPNLNRLMNQALPYAIFLLQWIMYCQRSLKPDLYFIDATSLKVCENKRIFGHKVCDGLAERGKSSMGWFFGFKLHAVCDSLGRLVSLMITSGNTDDRKFVFKLLKGLKGLCIADAGYMSKELMHALYQQGILFLTDVRKSMKRLMTDTQHAVLKLRQRIEGVFSCLKHRLKAEASIARSPLGYFSRCLYACLAFVLAPHLEAKVLLP
jgi:hypothetical protein